MHNTFIMHTTPHYYSWKAIECCELQGATVYKILFTHGSHYASS